MKKMFSPARGSATVASTVVLALLVVLGSSFIVFMTRETEMSTGFRDGISAQYLAEAGLKRALVVVYKNGNPEGLSEAITGMDPTGSYRLYMTSIGDNRVLRSVATVGKARRAVTATITVLPGGPVFGNVLFAGGSVDLENSGVISGDVRANEFIGLSGSDIQVKGRILTAREFLLSSGAIAEKQINGAVKQGLILVPALSLPDLFHASNAPVGVSSLLSSRDGFVSDNTRLDLKGKTLTADGNLSIMGTSIEITGPGVLYIRQGALRVEGARIQGDVVIVADRGIEIMSGVRMDKVLLISRGTPTDTGNISFTGKDITLVGAAMASGQISVDAVSISLQYDSLAVSRMLGRLNMGSATGQYLIINSWKDG